MDFPRRDYTTNFAFLIAGDDQDRQEYTSGLVVLGCILASVLAIWWMVLIVLKCKGRSVGCASGRSFRGEPIPQTGSNAQSSGSTDLEDEWVSGEERSGEHQAEEEAYADEVSFHSSIKSSEMDESMRSRESDLSGSGLSQSSISRASTRERRTQIAFFLFGVITLALVPMVLTLAFSPLKRAVDSTEVYLVQSRTILSEIQNSLNTVDVTVATAARVFEGFPTTTENLCPQKSFQEIKEQYNVDLDYIAVTLAQTYEQVYEAVERRLSDVISNLNEFDSALESFDAAHEDTETYLWVAPGLMLALTSVTAALLFGVLLAWKRQSSHQAQQTLSYIVLPCLIVLSLICWAIGISSAISVALLSDGCTSGGNESPLDMVESVLSLQGYVPGSTTFDIVYEFTSGCQRDLNPTAFIESTEGDIEMVINQIWSYVADIEAVGEDILMQACGSASLSRMLNDAQDIARLFTTIRRALSAITSSVQCQEIYPIYVGSVENTACTDLAIASSWSMYIFLLLGVSTMCMITLRASWRHKVGEDQIYNEDEVAENMFLDEHEEYLHYISKYKHEWEEYGGINSVVPMTPRHPQPSLCEESSVSEESTGSRTNSEEIVCNTDDDLSETKMNYMSQVVSQPFDPYRGEIPSSPSGTDCSTDISFPSLHSPDPAKESSIEVVHKAKEARLSTDKIGEIAQSSSSLDVSIFKSVTDSDKTLSKSGSIETKSSRRSRRMPEIDKKNSSNTLFRNVPALGNEKKIQRSKKDDKIPAKLQSSKSDDSRLQRKSWRNHVDLSSLSRSEMEQDCNSIASSTNLHAAGSEGSFTRKGRKSKPTVAELTGVDLAKIIQDLEQKSNTH